MISLREYAESDLERLVTLANNRNVSRYLVYTFPHPYTLKDAEWGPWLRGDLAHWARLVRFRLYGRGR
jgi:hypothetical protein